MAIFISASASFHCWHKESLSTVYKPYSTGEDSSLCMCPRISHRLILKYCLGCGLFNLSFYLFIICLLSTPHIESGCIPESRMRCDVFYSSLFISARFSLTQLTSVSEHDFLGWLMSCKLFFKFVLAENLTQSHKCKHRYMSLSSLPLKHESKLALFDFQIQMHFNPCKVYMDPLKFVPLSKKARCLTSPVSRRSISSFSYLLENTVQTMKWTM